MKNIGGGGLIVNQIPDEGICPEEPAAAGDEGSLFTSDEAVCLEEHRAFCALRMGLRGEEASRLPVRPPAASSYIKLNGSISTSTAVWGISLASQYAIAPLSSFVSTDRFGDFSRN
jgi:hypothetical protein